MEYKLSDAELTIMQILWEHGELRASHVADIAKEKTGWEKNTSYTFLHRLIRKCAVTRRDPGFYCSAACERGELLTQEARGLVDKLYGGSIGAFVHAFLDEKPITPEEKARLQKLIDESRE